MLNIHSIDLSVNIFTSVSRYNIVLTSGLTPSSSKFISIEIVSLKNK